MQIKTGQMKRLVEKSVSWLCDFSLWSPGAAPSVYISEFSSSKLSHVSASESLHAHIVDSLKGLSELGWISSPFLSPELRLAQSPNFFWVGGGYLNLCRHPPRLSLVYTQAKGSQITKISTTWVMKGLWKVCARNPVQNETKALLQYGFQRIRAWPCGAQSC